MPGPDAGAEVVLEGGGLTIEEVVRVARHGARVEIANAAGPGGFLAGVILNMAGPLIVGCTRTKQEQWQNIHGHSGGGVRINALDSKRTSEDTEDGARTIWEWHSSMPGGSTHNEDILLRFQGATKVELYYDPSYPYGGGYYYQSFTNYSTLHSSRTYTALLGEINEPEP